MAFASGYVKRSTASPMGWQMNGKTPSRRDWQDIAAY
jgi:hypothetical protein